MNDTALCVFAWDLRDEGVEFGCPTANLFAWPIMAAACLSSRIPTWLGSSPRAYRAEPRSRGQE
jgi:hypothetical protein